MKLWLDDYRPMPDEFDIQAFNAKDAIALLETGNVTWICLDHDLGHLGTPEETGYTVAKRIEELAYAGAIPRLRWSVHTANPVGGKNMIDAMVRAEMYWNNQECYGASQQDMDWDKEKKNVE